MSLRASILAATCLTPLSVLALPSGGVISAGVATVAAGVATVAAGGAQMSITQHSGRAVIDWRSFDVGAGERVSIMQPSTSSILLNRIHDQKPSQIYGSISANGRVVLANPNGMVFGPNSRVDVAGLVATASQIDSTAFQQKGRLIGLAGNPNAAIANEGTITAKDGGLIALVAPEVRNDGTCGCSTCDCKKIYYDWRTPFRILDDLRMQHVRLQEDLLRLADVLQDF
jgi:filamentous hemagglutinin family protein